MRWFSYIGTILVLSFLLSLIRLKIFTSEETNILLTVIGLIFGLIAAFAINNSWERFSKIRDEVSEETSSLINVNNFAKGLSDSKSYKKLKNAILEYCKDVPL